MAESLPTAGVLTHLSGGNDPRQILNRAGTQQSVPVRPSRWDRKGRRNCEKLSTGDGKASVQFRKAKVITDRDSQRQAQRINCQRLTPGRDMSGLIVGLAAGYADIKEMNLVITPDAPAVTVKNEAGVGHAAIGSRKRCGSPDNQDTVVAGRGAQHGFDIVHALGSVVTLVFGFGH